MEKDEHAADPPAPAGTGRQAIVAAAHLLLALEEESPYDWNDIPGLTSDNAASAVEPGPR